MTMPDSPARFTIDHKKAAKLCSAAAVILQKHPDDEVRRLLTRALYHRPSCALAFKLLGDWYRAADHEVAARVCYRNDLPEDFFTQAVENSAAPVKPRFNRIPVFATERTTAPLPLSATQTVAFSLTELESEACFIDRIEQGCLWHDDLNTQVFDQHGVAVLPHNVGCAALVNSLMQQYSPQKIDGRAILLGAKGAHNFYHWTTDLIPKLRVLEVAGIKLCSTDTIIVSRANASFARQFLQMAGIAPVQVIETESETPYLQADELIVPYVQNKMGYTMGRWLPGQMKAFMDVEAVPRTERKLFINRNPATAAGRTLVNSEAAEALFQGQGFEVVYPETLSIREQARLFASAGVIAGVHGAGLANIVYCAAGTRVIEFYGAHIAPCYWLISALAGLKYYQQSCAINNNDAASKHAAGMELDIDVANQLLQLANSTD